MSKAPHSGGWVILASALLALVLTVAPLPALLEAWRPPWLLLVTIYWVLALPERIGVGMAWAGGLLLDVVQGLPLGAHALAFALVAWLTMKLHRRLRIFPLWQQAMTVLLLTLLVRMLLFWVEGLTGGPTPGWWHWSPALTAMAVWPLIFLGLREMRRRFDVR
ncbi:rod shape-determining protein MreD [Arhodomonas sp. SL1]|uniref:rod shape-determining protein MreD n=1 Tax=Arhodomonas sp. SL1 TaxID=3425691 RepID=UPI003F880530